ncbi:MAG TPA: hypothetical protein PLW65_20915 [Pseudomonadota bacterium]|nr:hypothetical protein [Pseudomonadota bacterium]
MRALLDKLQATITDFIEQRDALWLRVGGSTADAPIVLKLLLSIERRNKGDVFLIYATPFANQEQYVDELTELFRAEYQALQEERSVRQHAPLQPLPDRFGGGPAQRLTALLRAAGELLPKEGRQRLVLAFWPLELADPVAYEQLLDGLVPAPVGCDSPSPWMRRLRLIGRQVGHSPAERHAVQYEERVLHTTADFSPEAVLRCLQETLADPRQPEGVRMRTLLMLATLDQAHGRDEAALARYDQLLAYYRRQQSPALQTVVLIQLGELCQKEQRLPAARAFYEQALAPAAAARVPVCTALLAKSFGDLAWAEQRHSDAAACYEAWHRLASQLGDHPGAQLALTKLTAARERSGPATSMRAHTEPVEASR